MARSKNSMQAHVPHRFPFFHAQPGWKKSFFA